MAITAKEKELVAVGISVAAGCKPCTDYHVKAVRKARASDEEIRQAVADALSVRNSAMKIMEAYALAHLVGEKRQGSEPGTAGETNRLKELVSIGAAFGVNCVSSLEKHLAAAENMGISPEDVTKILKLSAFIKEKAASHVERLAGTLEEKKMAAYPEEVGGCS